MGDKAEKNDLTAHTNADWRTAHGIWQNIQDSTIVKVLAQFRAYVSSAQNNLTLNAYVKVVLDGESYDRGACFDAVTDQDFTAPRAGLYHFDGQVQISTAQVNKDYYIYIYVNGSAVSSAYFASNNDGDNVTLRISDTIALALNDVVTLYVKSGQPDSTADIVTGSANSFFTGHIIAL